MCWWTSGQFAFNNPPSAGGERKSVCRDQELLKKLPLRQLSPVCISVSRQVNLNPPARNLMPPKLSSPPPIPYLAPFLCPIPQETQALYTSVKGRVIFFSIPSPSSSPLPSSPPPGDAPPPWAPPQRGVLCLAPSRKSWGGRGGKWGGGNLCVILIDFMLRGGGSLGTFRQP